MFRNEEESDNFFKQLNCLHPSLKFTFEKEKNNCLLFLDVNMEQTTAGFETSVWKTYLYWTVLTLGIFQSHLTKNKPYINFGTLGTNDMHEI